MAKEIRDKSDVLCNFYQSAKDVPYRRELSSEKKNLMVFEYLLIEKQNTCESYYVRGRHSNVDCFYLAQNYFKHPHAKESERTRISFVCFRKTWRTLTTFSMIMWEVTWLRKISDNYARQLGKNSTCLWSLILAVKNTTVNIEVGLTSFTYQIKLKIKTILIFSLQNGESS